MSWNNIIPADALLPEASEAKKTEELPVIMPRGFESMTPEEYHAYITKMHEKRGAKAAAPAEGITISQSATGKLTIRRSKAKRPLAYVLSSEIVALAKHYEIPQNELWNLFKEKEYLIAMTKREAEETNAKITEIPWK